MHPRGKAAMARLVRRIPLGQVPPPCTGAQNPQHTIHDLSCVALRPPPQACPSWRKQWLYQRPLLIGQFVASWHRFSHHEPDGKNRLPNCSTLYKIFLRWLLVRIDITDGLISDRFDIVAVYSKLSIIQTVNPQVSGSSPSQVG